MRLNNVKLSELGQGALQELFESELEKVIENINDINTDPTKKRKITMTIDIKSDEYREIIFADVKVKSNLVSMDSTGIKLFNIVDENGERVVNELRSGAKGQAFIDDDGSIKMMMVVTLKKHQRRKKQVKYIKFTDNRRI